MSEAIGLQCSFFLVSVLWGAILLVMYDVLRIMRRIKKHKWYTIAAEDLLFWILAAFLIFRMMYEQNDGIIRGFAVLGMFLGMIIYNQSVSDHLVKGVSTFLLFIGKQIRRFLRFLSKPFRLAGRFIKRKLGLLKKATGKCGKTIQKALKKHRKRDTLNE